MSTTTLERPTATATADVRAPIPTSRLIGVELQKMFDTRAGFWLITGGGIAALVATIATIAFAPHNSMGYGNFASAVGIPLSIVLPILGILSVTSEWSQRTGLSTFTMTPNRGRVIAAKAASVLLVGIASVAIALGIGALGNLVGSSIAGISPRWDISLTQVLLVFLGDALGMLMGFTLGVLIRNSPGAIVGYFVYALVLPGIFGALAAYQDWFARIQGWIDFQFSSTRLYDSGFTATDWAHLGVSGLIWLVIPLLVGLRLTLRSEVK